MKGNGSFQLNVNNANYLNNKHSLYYIQPKNLLDNSDFSDPVNQRSQLEYNLDEGYTIDRWIAVYSGSDCRIVADTGNKHLYMYRPTYSCYLEQRINPTLESSILNKKVTLAALVTGAGTIGYRQGYKGAAINAPATFDNDNEWHIVLTSFTIPAAGDIWFQISTQGNRALQCKWMALYEGEYTIETLPPYIPKGYAAELAECQRYFQLIIHNWAIGFYEPGYGNLQLHFPIHPMRAVPKIIYTHSGNAIYNSSTGWIDWSTLGTPTVSYYIKDLTEISISIPYTNNNTTHDCFLVNGFRALSCDL